MKEFIWRVAGGDCEILMASGKDSQRSFAIIGGLFLLINVIIVIGFFGMFYGIFDDFLLSTFGSLVFSFLISNIYRLNLISLEPSTLPRAEAIGSMVLSHSFRYIIVSAFSFFVSKCFEMVIVTFFENQGLMNYNGSVGYMRHLLEKNSDEPWLWFFTLIIIAIFILPVYLRHRLNKAKEYYSIKRKRDIRLVLNQHSAFKKEYNFIMTKVYSQYGKLNSDFLINDQQFQYNKDHLPSEFINNKFTQKHFIVDKKEKFEDPPFNTKLIPTSRSEVKSYKDFVELFSVTND